MIRSGKSTFGVVQSALMPPDAPVDVLVTLLPNRRAFESAPTRESLEQLPATPAIVLLADAHAQPVLLTRTQNLRRAVAARLVGPGEDASTRRADLASVVRVICWGEAQSAFEARWLYLRAARLLYPRAYRRQLDFGPAWFLHVDWSSSIPEIAVSERVWLDAGEFVGPWLARHECAAALDGLRDLFDLCRYPEQVARAPRGKRCAYADMGRCDAPCDGSVAMAAYVQRSREAWRFACAGAAAWVASARARMRAAATAQCFELAGQIKQQLAFGERWGEEWSPRIGEALDLNVALAIPVTRRRAWKLFVARGGCVVEGPRVRAATASMDAAAWLRRVLTEPIRDCDGALRMEQTWLIQQFCASDAAGKAIVLRFAAEAQVDGVVDEFVALGEARWMSQRERTNDRGPRSAARMSGDQAPP